MKRVSPAVACIPRVFSEHQFAERYEKHIERYTKMLGERFLNILREQGISNGSVLDAGCGAGQVAIALAQALPGVHVTGVDLGAAVLQLAQNRIAHEEMSDRVATQLADVESLPFPDDSFDVVINSSMLHMVEHPVQMLNELERVLKPSGLLLISNIKRVWLISLFEKAFRTTFTWPESKEIIEQSNIRPWSVTNTFFDFTLVSDRS